MQKAIVGAAFLAVTSCAQPSTSANLQSSPSASACVLTIQFPSEASRSNFILTNSSTAVERARSQEMFLQTDEDGRTVFVFTQHEICSDVTLDTAYGLRQLDGHMVGTNQLDADEIVRRLSITSAWTEESRQQCVVAFPAEPAKTGYLMATVPYLGLRKTQMRGADGIFYMGAEEECELVKDVALAAAQYFQLRDSNSIRSCQNSSFYECGYPR